MAAFGSAGLGQFGQELNSGTGNNVGGFLTGLAVKKSGLEDYLNKNLGISFSGGKLSEFKQPDGSVAPKTYADPNANTGMPANVYGAVPPVTNPANSNDALIPTTQASQAPQPLDMQNDSQSIGSQILDFGKNAIISSLL
jgi:hypothetical protein